MSPPDGLSQNHADIDALCSQYVIQLEMASEAATVIDRKTIQKEKGVN